MSKARTEDSMLDPAVTTVSFAARDVVVLTLAGHQRLPPWGRSGDPMALQLPNGLTRHTPPVRIEPSRSRMPILRQVSAPTSASQPFGILLASCGQVLTVAADQTLLEVLLDEGINIISLCEEGTCEIGVLAGYPQHLASVPTVDKQDAADR